MYQEVRMLVNINQQSLWIKSRRMMELKQKSGNEFLGVFFWNECGETANIRQLASLVFVFCNYDCVRSDVREIAGQNLTLA